jgi:hypothetical protein
MNKLAISTALLAAGIALALPVIAESEHDDDDNTLTLAVFGDAPYGCKSGECPAGYSPDTPNGPNPGDLRQIEATPDFVKAVNSDPKVRLVIHTGDIHAGSTYCTLAYNQTVFNLWTEFRDPLVYTPGDNEWADCQKSGEGGGVKNAAGEYVDYAAGHPVANLALVRSMFFPEAGVTLGGRKKRVISQAEAFDPAHPADGEYVENVMWEQSRVVFVTVNIPGGSNNDDDTWTTGAFGSAFGTTSAGGCLCEGQGSRRERRGHRRAGRHVGPRWQAENSHRELLAVRAQDCRAHQRLQWFGAADQRRFAQLPLGQSVAE